MVGSNAIDCSSDRREACMVMGEVYWRQEKLTTGIEHGVEHSMLTKLFQKFSLAVIV